jgi:signal transduction histidine kinase
VLFLGQKKSGSPFSEEEIELAQAGGERLVDLLAGSEMAHLSLDLLRQRLTEARVLEGQGRRVLHDEVLPELHTALLYLSENAQNRDSVEILSAAHRRISDLLRASSPDVPARLAEAGLGAALRSLVELEYSKDFTTVAIEMTADGEEAARLLTPLAAEAVYFAARELVRNAASYGRGGSAGRALSLALRLDLQDDRIRVTVEDDGVGIGNSAGSPASGNGLRIHSAMLAAVGGSLEVNPGQFCGTCARISL